MKKALVVIAALPLLVSNSSLDGHATEPAETSAAMPVSMAPEDIVAARRATFFLSTQAIGQIKAGIEEGGDLRRARGGARMLEGWAKALPTMFPEGTDIEGSRALANVWTDREGFEARAATYQAAAADLAAKAAEGDRAGADEAFRTLAGTCHACHQSYREE